jgi:HlyD family secretion protein
VPTSAIFRRGDGWAVYAVEDGRAVVRSVRPGRRTGLAVQIEEGLTEGAQVIIHPGDDVEDGVRIRIR